MRKVKVEEIREKQKLGRTIYSSQNAVILSKGTFVTVEYAKKLKSLNIDEIYIEDEISRGVREEEVIENHIKDLCYKKVKEAINRFSYSSEGESAKLKMAADEIITEILDNKNVMYNIAGVRHKSESLYSHCLSVCALSTLISLKMELPRDTVKSIAEGAILHDIGVHYTSLNIEQCDVENLTIEEQRELRKHVIYGYNVVKEAEWLSPLAKNIMLSHHECLDGTGYPFHVSGEHLKLGVRIVAICDLFDCMVYGFLRKKEKVHLAIEYIVSEANLKYDARIVEIFQKSIAAYPNGTIVITNTGEKGIVLRQNNNFPTRPVLKIIGDVNGSMRKEYIEKDLTKHLTIFIHTIEE